MNHQITEYVQQLGRTEFVLGVDHASRPLIDMQRALDVERMGIELTFPELAEARTAKKTPDEWREQYQRIFSQELGVQLSDDKSPPCPSPDELEKRCRDRLPAAKKYLIAGGLPAKEIEEMPTYQIATLYTLAIYHENLDDAIKCYSLALS